MLQRCLLENCYEAQAQVGGWLACLFGLSVGVRAGVSQFGISKRGKVVYMLVTCQIIVDATCSCPLSVFSDFDTYVVVALRRQYLHLGCPQ